jgi:uncharacterized protein (DUF362 family)
LTAVKAFFGCRADKMRDEWKAKKKKKRHV